MSASSQTPADQSGRADSRKTHQSSAEGLIQQSMAQDPLFVFLEKYWRQIVVVGLAIAAIFYVRQSYLSAQDESQKRAADAFLDFESVFVAERQELSAPHDAGAAGDASRSDARDRVRAMITSLEDQPSPYREIGELYMTILSSDVGTIDVQQFNTVKDANGSRFIDELQQLVIIRKAIDSDATRDKAFQALVSLAATAQYVGPTALGSAARIAKDAEERDAVKATASSLQSERPELRDAILAALSGSSIVLSDE